MGGNQKVGEASLTKVKVAQLCPTLCDPMDYSLPDSFYPWNFSRQEYWSGLPCRPPGDLPNPRIKSRSPSLQTDSLLSEPPGKPKNTGVGSLSLLQGIFLTQESNQGLLQCRWIFYQLSYQGSQASLNLILNMSTYIEEKKSSLIL